MRRFAFALAGAATLLAMTTLGMAKTAGPTIVMSGQEKWASATGMMKGAQVAVLAGDPKSNGLYIIRVKVPAGAVFPAHYHNETENVSVVSGTLWVGVGDKMDKSKMIAMGPGAFCHIPAKLHHYAMTKTVTVFDITGVGPQTMMAVKP